MKLDAETNRQIFDRTEGKCHICRKKLTFRNYGDAAARASWEVEHSVPRSQGGTDHGNNLFPACIACNRSKGNSATRTVRAKHGFRRAPYSASEREENAQLGGVIGALIGLVVFPPHLRLAAIIIAGGIGAVMGHKTEPR